MATGRSREDVRRVVWNMARNIRVAYFVGVDPIRLWYDGGRRHELLDQTGGANANDPTFRRIL